MIWFGGGIQNLATRTVLVAAGLALRTWGTIPRSHARHALFMEICKKVTNVVHEDGHCSL